ncbi:MAG: M28 family peptidase [Gemmatimonadales bacterium]|nr:M28 family peptidase [Gemmatimonadales bacterium]
MKRVIGALAAAAVACGGSGLQRPSFDGERALEYVEAQLAFGPRVPNTEGHRQAGDWIESQLRIRADSVEVQEFRHVTAAGDTLMLRNFIGKFRPDVRDRVVYVAHWDTRPQADQSANLGQQRLPVPGANDGASGVALLLAVADALRESPPAYGIDLVFVDGEDYGDFSAAGRPDVLIGSRHYAATLDADRLPLFAVVWDMIGDRDLQIYREGYSLSEAPEVVERVWRTAEDLGYGRVFLANPVRSVVDDHVPLQERGVRAIDVIDFDYPPWHTTEDTMDKVGAESLQIVGEVALALIR